MSQKAIVLVSGYAQAGKDTFANAVVHNLVGREPNTFKFAEALREALAYALGVLRIERSVWTEIKEEKDKLRPVLVELGEYARGYDEDVFANFLADEIETAFTAFTTDVALVTDLRYHNEHQILKALATRRGWQFYWVHIVREGNLPANDKERASVTRLLDNELPTCVYRAPNGEAHIIESCARDFVRTYLTTSTSK
jgi:hypothetical protein